MGFNFVTEIDSQKFLESMEQAFKDLNNKTITDVKFSTAAVPKPLPTSVGIAVPEFDFVTEYSAVILWTD